VMVFFAYGALGLIDVTRDLWIKESLSWRRSRPRNRAPRSFSKMRISVSCSRAGLAAFASTSSSRTAVRCPSFGPAIASSGSHDLGRDDMKVLDVKFERMGEFQARWPASETLPKSRHHLHRSNYL
jgi:hypothetical protein